MYILIIELVILLLILFAVGMTVGEIIILLIAIFLRKQIHVQSHGVSNKLLHTEKSIEDKIYEILLIVCRILCLFGFIGIFLGIIVGIDLSFFYSFYGAVLTTLVIPSAIDILSGKNKSDMLIWKLFLLVFALILVFLEQIDLQGEMYIEAKVYLLAIYWAIFISSIIEIFIAKKRAKEIGFHKEIYKDLTYRVTNLELSNINGIELNQLCEKYYWQYLQNYNRNLDVKCIDYGSLNGIGKRYWYKKAIKKIHYISIFSILLLFINAVLTSWWWQLCLISVFVILYVIGFSFKRNDEEYFMRIVIRIYYGEWGWFLKSKKMKFIGIGQLFRIGRKYNLIYSMLNIVAFCRVIASDERFKLINGIQLITDNMCELLVMHKQEKEEQWIRMIPLLISALFEFNSTGMISQKAKQLIQEYQLDDGKKREIECFLQGIWAEVTGRVPTPADGLFIRGFCDLLMEEKN